MKPYIPVVAPRFLGAISLVIPISNITLWPFIVSLEPMDEGDERHELIHVVQQLEVNTLASLLLLVLIPWLGPWTLIPIVAGWLPFVGWFYLLYALSFLINLARGFDAELAYRGNWFEAEAYGNDHDVGYLIGRRWFSWALSS